MAVLVARILGVAAVGASRLIEAAGLGDVIDIIIGLDAGKNRRSRVFGKLLRPFRRDTANRIVKHL